MNQKPKDWQERLRAWLNKKFSDIAIEDLGIGIAGKKALVGEICVMVEKDRNLLLNKALEAVGEMKKPNEPIHPDLEGIGNLLVSYEGVYNQALKDVQAKLLQLKD